MDGTTSTVNYLPPMSNDYYNHHSFQPIQALGNGSYYEQDAIDCLYNHQKVDFQSPVSYSYPIAQAPPPYSYQTTAYETHLNQSFIQEPSLIVLPNGTHFQTNYSIPPQQVMQSMPCSNRSLSATATTSTLKREAEEANVPMSTGKVSHGKSGVFEWMKGTTLVLL